MWTEQNKDNAREVLQESLRFCLYPKPMLERFGPFGLDLIQKLLGSATFLHLFPAIDIICAFFSGMAHAGLRLPTLPLSQERGYFATLYREYPRYINALFDKPVFRMVKEDLRQFVGPEKSSQEENELLVYRAFFFILAELALECPFVSTEPPFPSHILRTIKWQSLVIPERRPFAPQEEQVLLENLGLDRASGPDTLREPSAEGGPPKSRATSIEGAAVDTRVEVLFGTVSQCYKKRDDKGFQDGNPGARDRQGAIKGLPLDIARLPHSLDYKLINSYLEYFDQFDLDDELRHKLSRLKQISCLSTDKSPFISEYSQQWTSGAPNPSFLIQGWKKFVLKMLEGAPVFLGKPDPLFDQDTVAIRFFFLEEMKAVCEKALNPESQPRFSHHNVHKLTALLIAHDMVKYLGAISRMEMSLEFIKYNKKAEIPTRSTGVLHTRVLRGKVSLDEGFMVRNRLVQREMLTDAALPDLGVSTFDTSFFLDFFKGLDAQLPRSARFARTYDFYFGTGGTFLKENGSPAVLTGHGALPSQEEFSPSQGLAESLTTRLSPMLSNPSRWFACETNSRSVLAVGTSAGIFKAAVIDYSLGPFLDSVRRIVLNLVIDEAIRFRLEQIARMKQ